MKNSIIYIYDPLCGWCYGFSQIIEQLKEDYKDRLDWCVYSGGMTIGENIFKINEASKEMSDALLNVEKTTNIKFGEQFKNNILKSDYLYSSLKPSIALTVFKEINNEQAINFAVDIQKAFFYEGKDLNNLDTYLELIKKYDISDELFREMYENPSYEAKTYNEDFRKPRQFGVNGFPVIIFKKGDKNLIIARGYQKYEKISKNIEILLNA